MPRTVVAREPHQVGAALEAVGGPPVILKLIQGTQGIGVILAETEQAVQSVLDTLWSLGQTILIQEFVAESEGRDIRALVLGNRVVTAMRRQARFGEFRSNIHRGGGGTVVDLDEDYKRAAIQASQVMGLQLSGRGSPGVPRGAQGHGDQLLARLRGAGAGHGNGHRRHHHELRGAVRAAEGGGMMAEELKIGGKAINPGRGPGDSPEDQRVLHRPGREHPRHGGARRRGRPPGLPDGGNPRRRAERRGDRPDHHDGARPVEAQGNGALHSGAEPVGLPEPLPLPPGTAGPEPLLPRKPRRERGRPRGPQDLHGDRPARPVRNRHAHRRGGADQPGPHPR